MVVVWLRRPIPQTALALEFLREVWIHGPFHWTILDDERDTQRPRLDAALRDALLKHSVADMYEQAKDELSAILIGLSHLAKHP